MLVSYIHFISINSVKATNVSLCQRNMIIFVEQIKFGMNLLYFTFEDSYGEFVICWNK